VIVVKAASRKSISCLYNGGALVFEVAEYFRTIASFARVFFRNREVVHKIPYSRPS